MKYGVKILAKSTMIGGMMMAAVGSAAFGQLYSGWSHYQDYIMNPRATGITTNQINFPVLLRLTSANSAVFNGVTPGIGGIPNDIRFAKGNNLNMGYRYQVERWDTTDKLAEIWVLIDTVFSGSTAQGIRMYWGNDTAQFLSSGPAVFNAGNGFRAVWHLQDTNDACGNLPLTGASKPTPTAAGIIGVADSFNGTNQYLFTADSTSVNADTLNFANGGPFTLSAWEYLPPGNTYAERAIVDKGNTNWELKEMNTSGVIGGLQFLQVSLPGEFLFCRTSLPPILGNWHHVFFVRTQQGSSPIYAESLYVDGVLQNDTVYQFVDTIDTQTLATTHPVAIGNRPEGGSYFWSGKLDEVEVANVGRSADWIRLCFANQNANQTFILPEPSAPVLSSPTNGAVNQPVALSLVWGSVSGSTSYGVQVSTDVNFGSTVLQQSGLSATFQSIAGLTAGTLYYWRVNATAIIAGPWSSAWSFTTITPVTLLSPANGATGQSISPTLTWNSLAGAMSYSLQVSTSTAFSTVAFAQFGITGTSQVATGLASQVTYYWRVIAGSIQTSNWSGVWSFTTFSAPVLELPVNGATNQSIAPTLSWAGVAGAQSYTLQVATNNGFTTTVLSQHGIVATSQTMSGIANATTYYWRVNAYDGVSQTSSWSAVWSFTTISPVTLLSPANGATGQSTSPPLTWNGISGATSYSLQVSTSPAFSTMAFTQSGISGTS
ncbi:MAG: DUF2341 domain-containing protein, partial [Chitinispirillaceae bacterium]